MWQAIKKGKTSPNLNSTPLPLSAYTGDKATTICTESPRDPIHHVSWPIQAMTGMESN